MLNWQITCITVSINVRE